MVRKSISFYNYNNVLYRSRDTNLHRCLRHGMAITWGTVSMAGRCRCQSCSLLIPMSLDRALKSRICLLNYHETVNPRPILAPSNLSTVFVQLPESINGPTQERSYSPHFAPAKLRPLRNVGPYCFTRPNAKSPLLLCLSRILSVLFGKW